MLPRTFQRTTHLMHSAGSLNSCLATALRSLLGQLLPLEVRTGCANVMQLESWSIRSSIEAACFASPSPTTSQTYWRCSSTSVSLRTNVLDFQAVTMTL